MAHTQRLSTRRGQTAVGFCLLFLFVLSCKVRKKVFTLHLPTGIDKTKYIEKMKQTLLYSLLLCAFLMGMVACSSDDAEIMGPALSDVNADYQNASTSKALEIYYSGSLLSGSKTVTFHSEDKQVAMVTLKNIVPGVETLELRDVLLSSSKDQTQYLFSGTVLKSDYTVDYEGTVAKEKMTLNLSVSLVANDEVTGRWILQKSQMDGEVYKKQSVFFHWDTTEDFPGFKIKTSDGYNLTLSGKDAANNIAEGLSKYMDTTGLIKEMTFRPDGNLIVVYAKGDGTDASWQESDLNQLQYFISNNTIYLCVSDKLLQSNLDEDAFMGVLKVLLQQYTTGIPLEYDSSESGKLKLYIDKKILANNKLVSMTPMLSTLLPKQSETLPVSLMQNVLENYSTAIKATTNIALGLNFTLVKQGTSY